MTKNDILDYLRLNKDLLNQQHGIITVGLFGSYARGDERENSDVDIAIEILPEKKTLRNFFAIKRLLESQFNTSVDLGIESTLKSVVREQVKKEIIYV